jgi:hypothetical protein
MGEEQPIRDEKPQRMVRRNTPDESFFGRVLIAVGTLFFLALIGTLLFAGYRAMRDAKDARSSIVSLSEEALILPAEPKPDDVKQPAEPSPDVVSSTIDKDMRIIVLNGGAAKGSAAAAQTLLKATGFVNVTTGNADKDHTGVTVYYDAPERKASADAAKDALAKKHTAVSTKQSGDDPDTRRAALVVIVGK